MSALRHTWQVTLRYLRALLRQPAWIGITLFQPMIWLLLFGALFKSIARIPGFHGGSYIEFLTPGLIVMLAISSAGWSGMAYIEDMNIGVMDRFLVSPIWRGALNGGSVTQQVIIIAFQSVIVAALSLAVGGHFPNGVGGVAILIGVAALLGASFASLSNALALVVRQRESLIGAVTSVTLPLTFLSTAFMQQTLVPSWIRWVARFNPVNWAVQAGRSAAIQHTDWSLVLSRTALLSGLLLVSAWLATRPSARTSALSDHKGNGARPTRPQARRASYRAACQPAMVKLARTTFEIDRQRAGAGVTSFGARPA